MYLIMYNTAIFNSMNHSLSVRPVNRYKIKPDMGKEFRELDFGTVQQNLQEEYLDIYEGIQLRYSKLK